jgi:type IV secretory pathway TrbL component
MARPSLKRLQIDKANSTMLIVLGVAVFITIFSLLSSKTLLGELFYQNRAVSAKEKALTQLKANVGAEQQLVTAYEKFVGSPTNLIGGATTGTATNDGDNAKIILDALPSQYDFPALTTSIQDLLSSQGVKIQSISGTDEEASVSPSGSTTPSTGTATATPATAPPAAAATTTPAAATPATAAVAMPFQFSVDGPYANIESLVKTFEASIRPFQLQTVQLSGGQSDLTLTVTAQSYYQPQKDFTITKETIK